ncbi:MULTISPECIES: hypothetical protein [unclassified Moorena]|uniref:hypothetical protein n=1 Tax=unclassified Moorena TaxID=2683338 RepID=UPI0013BBACD7|nr:MULTISPECIES: hypothetical protein [unclassified Moorena]NEP33541.1 hypothetical protein [Moorena sp. SIO3B2]NER88175.1 hypothetical protein [Moorena sp. SIO3A2]NES40339.1 hypothetical protein [Moorena sp. SIO2C4]NET65325.1 hypothetical protein [Moorena sp. SIO1G6]
MLETAARYINRHSQTIDLRSRYANEQNQADITQLRVSLNETLRLFSELATYQRQSQEEIIQNQEEIRQSQEEIIQNQQEIRRIWEYLLNQSGNGRSGN